MKEKIKDYKKYLIWASVPLFLFLVFFSISKTPSAASIYITRFSYPLRQTIGRIVQYIPFSLMECSYALAGIWAVYFIVRSVIIIRKSENRWDALARRVFILAIVILYICCIYTMVFGLDYYGPGFQEKAGIERIKISEDQLAAVTRYFAQKANEYAKLAYRDDAGRYAENIDEMFDYAEFCYDGIYEEFPVLYSQIFQPKKVLFSAIMSYAGFTGVYFPFFGESNINIHSPGAFIPSTIAHEIAHQKGITSEAECNFVGILACITCGNNTYAYSGYLKGLVHLMNALGRVDRNAWIEIRSGFSEQLQQDWDENNEYWSKMDISITSLIDTLYDGYLKNTGQPLGSASYGACVNLLVWYYSQDPKLLV